MARKPYELDEDDEVPRRRKKTSTGVPVWVWVVSGAAGVAFVVLLVVVSSRGGRPGRNNEPAVSYTKMTADELFDEWGRNPAAATDKYATDGVEVTGTLEQIDSNIHQQTYIELRGERKGLHRSAHIFVLSDRAKEGLKRCEVGQRIIVKARADGSVNPNPWLSADEVEPSPGPR